MSGQRTCKSFFRREGASRATPDLFGQRKSKTETVRPLSQISSRETNEGNKGSRDAEGFRVPGASRLIPGNWKLHGSKEMTLHPRLLRI